jgi:class 3 adenylate cyclase/tetratricopeptide (TPR) repeat protein
VNCAVCDHPLPDGARFCSNCGTAIESSLRTDERKLVTILFADLVDSTGLAQRLDPERARNVLGRFYEAVTEELRNLRGQPEKFIGDAVMAVFGLTQVHEDDAVRAVRAGLAIRGRIRRLGDELGLEPSLDVHVGVETGEAAIGLGPSGQLLATGSVVNMAARLQAAAGKGEVLAGATTRALTERSVSFGERRDVEAKGFGEELVAYPVEGLTSRSARRTIPIVGRTFELDLLANAHARVAATGRPLLVTVLGEPGIGKSRLVDEFVAGMDPIAGGAGGVFVGRNNQSSDSATFGPAAGIVRIAAGIDHRLPADEALRRLVTFVDGWDIEDAAERQRTIDRLALILGVAIEAGNRDESTFIQEVQSGFVELVVQLVRGGPVTLLFEDGHTLRPPMLDLIERLVEANRRDPAEILVVVAARPELVDARPTWGTRAVNHVLLRLEPLADVDAVALARQAGGSRLSETESRTVAMRAGGNPFFIIETTGMLLGRDGDRRADDGRTGTSANIPATVQAVIASRLDSLPDQQRELARRLSVYLYAFDATEAALVAECSADALQALEDAEIVVRDSSRATPHWRFRHETLRDVAYASLPKRLRMELHLAIAQSLLDTEYLSFAADHLECAATASLDLDPTDRGLAERAVDALAAAGDRARRRMENRSAVDYYERALTLLEPGRQPDVREAHILVGIGEARYWLSEYAAASEVLERARALGSSLNDDWTLAHALRFLGDIAINVEADVDRAEEMLEASLVAAERLGDPRTISRTLLFAGWVPWTRDRYDESEVVWRRALDIAREGDDRWAQVRALTALSINQEHMKDYDEARTLIDEAFTLAEDMDDQFSAAVAKVQRARVNEDTGRYAEALPDLDRGVEVFAGLGARWEQADALAERGIVHRELGRLDEAERDLGESIQISEELGERQLTGWTWRALAAVAEKRGDLEAANERARRAKSAEATRPR